MSDIVTDRLGGLPAPLPPGEAIVWQGRPDAGALLNEAFHARSVGIYFLVLAGAGLVMGSITGALLTLGAGAMCVGVLALLARASARTTVYTLTDKRLVLRVGIALPMHFNLPLKQIAGADLRQGAGGRGDISLRLAGKDRIAWAMLWPHVRPWRMRNPEPTLRSIPDAQDVARMLHHCCAALVEVEVAAADSAPLPATLGRPARIASRHTEAVA